MVSEVFRLNVSCFLGLEECVVSTFMNCCPV